MPDRIHHIRFQRLATNVIVLEHLNDDDAGAPTPTNTTPNPVDDAVVTFTIFEDDGTPFPGLSGLPMNLVGPGEYRVRGGDAVDIPPGSYRGQVVATSAAGGRKPFPLRVTVVD